MVLAVDTCADLHALARQAEARDLAFYTVWCFWTKTTLPLPLHHMPKWSVCSMTWRAERWSLTRRDDFSEVLRLSHAVRCTMLAEQRWHRGRSQCLLSAVFQMASTG